MTAAVALLACAAVPGRHVATALLLVLPVLAVLAAAVFDELPARARPARPALLAAVLVAGAVGAGPMVAAASAPNPDRSGLTAWVEAQLDPGTALQVDPLTGAQLLRDGIPARAPDPAGSTGPRRARCRCSPRVRARNRPRRPPEHGSCWRFRTVPAVHRRRCWSPIRVPTWWPNGSRCSRDWPATRHWC